MQVSGKVVHGIGAWRPRIERYPEVFLAGTGQRLFPGTLNVLLESPLPIREEFRIRGVEIGEPDQDMLLSAAWSTAFLHFDYAHTSRPPVPADMAIISSRS